ncbi:hypothetical protein RvY_01298-2 [Ramazzottius varieornatus]|uniref:Ig-like domain-containing protein n=1 Tax=Ramazzottius varieornatus TaxID=947166 RepID=A0A1D1UJS5_RAMVA|nr:hypothetical protein RvY_01298-2 [Ramazzottius varieornatus]
MIFSDETFGFWCGRRTDGIFNMGALYRSLSLTSLIWMLFSSTSMLAEGADSIYAILGNAATITCSGYDKVKLNSTGNVSDVYSLRWFKNQRSTDYILFTYLDLPPHRITMPQNEWKDRNVTFSILDQPQIRLPNVTFRDDATYICDLTPASRNVPVISQTRLQVVACPETVELSIINSTSDGNRVVDNNTFTPATITSLSSATPSFMRGSQIQVRCTTVSYPEASLSLTIPGLGIEPQWQNLSESAADRGYTRRTLDALFTLDGTESQLRGPLTIDCRSSVANGTCANTNSIAIQVVVPQTKSLRNGGASMNQDGSIATASLTGGQITGIVIGCIVGVALIAAVAYMAIRHTNKGRSKIDPSPAQTPT